MKDVGQAEILVQASSILVPDIDISPTSISNTIFLQ